MTVNADLSLALCVRIVSRDINCKSEKWKRKWSRGSRSRNKNNDVVTLTIEITI